MNKFQIYLLCVIFVIICCCERHKQVSESLNSGDAVIGYGTSFGECSGYCIKELKLDQLVITFRASSWLPADYPDKILQDVIERNEYEQLQSLVNFNKIAAFDDVIGCPDCADGGAEWLEVITDDRYKKITFENGDSLATIQPLINKLRQMYTDYNRSMFPIN
ncbi:MAG TPA: hypothetical protein PLP19_02320 [bacterium]|nr:hypothetical protein [bacterium]HPN42303.1 hypothetical protein [bacterium]